MATKKSGVRPKRHYCALIILGVIGILIVWEYVASLIPKNCEDIECFVNAANDGRAAKLRSTDKTGIEWGYQIKGNAGGGQIFTKTLLRLDDKELPQIKEFMEGKSLTCQFKSGKFDERWTVSLISGLENCQGELKENIGQLLFLL